MPAKNTHVVPQWQRNAFIAAVMLGLFGMANASSGEATYGGGSSVPSTVANTPAAGNVPRTALNPLASDPKRNSVVFKKKGISVKKVPDCGSKESCGTQKNVFRSQRPRRPDDTDVGVGVSGNNNKQSAKVRAKVPF